MAKRSRGAARPGQLRPSTRRPQQQPKSSGRAAAATTDVARTTRPAADELDTAIEAQVADRPATRTRMDRPVEREKTIVQPGRSRAQPSGLLAQRAAEEYGYVARDVRHIGVVGGALFVILIALFLVVEVAHVVTL